MPLALLHAPVLDIVLCGSSVFVIIFSVGDHTVLPFPLENAAQNLPPGIVRGRAVLPPASMARVYFGGSQRKTSALFEWSTLA